MRIAKVFTLLLFFHSFSPVFFCFAETGSLYENDIKVHAPELRADLDWINTDRPIQIKDHPGKFILLDFWTYGGINCQHIIPDLKALEEKYPNELMIVGVHSAKFSAEQKTENIREAVLRLGIDFPVVNDRQLLIWKDYAVSSWPTVMLIDPEGNIIGRKSGEGIFEPVDKVMERSIKKFGPAIDRKPFQLTAEKNKEPDSLLRFPGKILADEAAERLFVADSGHNQIQIIEPDGTLLETIGTGDPGQMDGAYDEAQFSNPQGMTLMGPTLYVADADNHLIRAIDLKSRSVSTAAGVGIQGTNKDISGPPDKIAFSSPWDLTGHGYCLYIAMAGFHQIWKLDLATRILSVHAGDGREDLIDGINRLASLAQPSGLTTDGEELYFVDSEVSAVRSSDILPTGKVKTLVGEGLANFGDQDGDSKTARLQHPLSIMYFNGLLYLVDTYNNKIKIIDPVNKTTRTFAGTGKSGNLDGKLKTSQFNEPGGITSLDNAFYVADTNNHAIRKIDLKSGMVSTVELKAHNKETKSEKSPEPEFPSQQIDIAQVFSQSIKDIHLKITLPPHGQFLPDAPSQLRILTAEGEALAQYKIESLDAVYPVDLKISSSTLEARLMLNYCQEGDQAQCLMKCMLFKIPLSAESAATTIDLNADIFQTNPNE